MDGDVEDPDGGVGEFLHAVRAVALSRDDFDADLALIDGDLRYFRSAQVAVSRLHTLQLRREVDPQLHGDVRGAVGVRAGHLGVHDASACGHELQVARLDGAFVASEVFVVDGAVEDVGYCFLASVGVVGEACAGGDGGVVEHEEGAEVAEGGGSDRATDASTGAFGLFCGEEGLLDCPRHCHVCGLGGSEGGEWNGG